MTKRVIAISLILAALALPAAAAEISLTIHGDRVTNSIDEKVYGHFLEHIYHSVNGGLWGDLVWNRSFEQNDAGEWSATDEAIVQQGMGTNQRFVFGDPGWGDYEYTLEAQKTGGSEGFLVLFRVANEKEFYWCNLGGWGNERHGLERGRASQARWHPVGPTVPGRIEPDRWYKIKVRCEGPQIRVWLDGDLLIDFRDPQGHRTGAVGVGTWATQARFRKLAVTSLDGKTLFTGLPPRAGAAGTAKHWRSLGSGELSLESSDAANGRFCQRIAASAGEAGLAQSPFMVRTGETYRGSLWVRGKAPGGLTVRLRGKAGMLAQAAIDAPGAEWRECAFALAPSADEADATLEIVVAGAGDVCIDQVSLMPESWRAAGGFRPDLVEAVAALRPPVIRWPGGCFASAYRWKDGIGPQHKRASYPREIWDDLDVNSFGTDEFLALCRKVGAEPLIVVNIGTKEWNGDVNREDFLQEVRDWIEYCNGPADSTWGKVRAANGHPEPYGVKYWEIDNETWHMGAEAYAEAVRVFAPAMKQADGSIRLAACGSAGYGDDRNGLAWNRTVIERCAELVDYLSIHHYENPDNFDRGPRDYEAFFHRTAALVARSRNPELKIYVSEWNAQSTDWRTGLYCGGLLNAFERAGDALTVGGPALFLRHVSAEHWDNAFINFDQRAWFAAPNYVVMKLWREHYAPQRVELTGAAAPLNAVATRSADGKRLILKAVNPSAESVAVRLEIAGDDTPRKAQMTLVAPGALDARNTLAAPAAVAPRSAPVALDGRSARFELPPWSAAVVDLQALGGTP